MECIVPTDETSSEEFRVGLREDVNRLTRTMERATEKITEALIKLKEVEVELPHKEDKGVAKDLAEKAVKEHVLKSHTVASPLFGKNAISTDKANSGLFADVPVKYRVLLIVSISVALGSGGAHVPKIINAFFGVPVVQESRSTTNDDDR